MSLDGRPAGMDLTFLAIQVTWVSHLCSPSCKVVEPSGPQMIIQIHLCTVWVYGFWFKPYHCGSIWETCPIRCKQSEWYHAGVPQLQDPLIGIWCDVGCNCLCQHLMWPKRLYQNVINSIQTPTPVPARWWRDIFSQHKKTQPKIRSLFLNSTY